MGSGSLTDLPHEVIELAHRAGIDTSDDARSASFYHVDQETIYSVVNDRFRGQIELLDVKDALERYDWVRDYFWDVVSRDADEYTRKVDQEFSGGYFMHILGGAKVDFPLQSCLMLTEKKVEQRIHNLIIAEPGSEARIISGCVTEKQVAKGAHLGISEFYIKEGANLNFTMIHNWSENVVVRPRSAARVEKDASFISNYICLQPSLTCRCIRRRILSGRTRRLHLIT